MKKVLVELLINEIMVAEKKNLKKKKKDVVINTRQLNGYFHRLQWVGGQEEGS